jgi:hypothetical protein
MEMFDIDDTFCVAHGGQQLAFWNAHHDERGFAPMHIYHAESGAPVVAILRPARTPERHGGEDRHQARDEASEEVLAEHPHRVARRRPLRPHEVTHLCELHLPGWQLDTAAQSGGAARMFAAA